MSWVVLFALGATTVSHAEDAATPEQEYARLVRVSDAVQPLGEHPFGERIGLYDGSLSFRQVDISLPGTGPDIRIARTFSLNGAEPRIAEVGRAFGDWELDLPRIETLTGNQFNVKGWVVAGDNAKSICSHFGAPPSVNPPNGDAKRRPWPIAEWWAGYHLHTPDAGTQDLLKRGTASPAPPALYGLSYPIVTREDWTVGCLGQAANVAGTEGFLAVSPDGTRYWLDHLAYRWAPNITRGLGENSPGGRSGEQSRAALDDILLRREGRMLVTRVEDRFGNWVNYSYTGDDLSSIQASDGRQLAFHYEAGTPRIAAIVVQPGSGAAMTYRYGYGQHGHSPTLTSLTLGDGSAWQFALGSLANDAWVDMREVAGSCSAIGTPSNMGRSYEGTIQHPSGLRGIFVVSPIRRGRSHVDMGCWAAPGKPTGPTVKGTYALTPNAWHGMAITSRLLVGSGVNDHWTYAYSPSNESWEAQCRASGCEDTVWTDVAGPDGRTVRSRFSNRLDYTESLLLSTEQYDGGPGSRTLRYENFSYLAPQDPQAALYGHPWGVTPQRRVNTAQLQEKVPLASRTVVRDGDSYRWGAQSYDGFARPRDTWRSSSVSGEVHERRTYIDDVPAWVLGLPSTVENLTMGETIQRYVYEPSRKTLAERYDFKRLAMRYSFNDQGGLRSFTDGEGHATLLDDYRRGIPQAIVHADGTRESVAVDDMGRIAATTDPAGAITSYAYDALGRVSRIDPPTGDSVAWHAKRIDYRFAGSEQGVEGGHWVRTSREGDLVETTHYDTMLRPVLEVKARSDGAMASSSRHAYNEKSKPTFESYPTEGAPALGEIVAGRYITYDGLGRPIQETSTSEQGNLVAATTYLSGARVQFSDARGQVFTTTHQAYEETSYDRPTRIESPEGLVQSIRRDVYGLPQQVDQSGGGASSSKLYFYDENHALCRRWEPESGSEVIDYDRAGNVAWRIGGVSIAGDSCGRSDVNGDAVTRHRYDSMNRLSAITYPGSTPTRSFTYDAAGRLKTARSGDVVWTYEYNKRGLPTSEAITTDGWRWAFAYGYDAGGALSTLRYPDGETIEYRPDALGRPTTAGPYAAGMDWFADGDLRSMGMAGGSYLAGKNGRGLIDHVVWGRADGAIEARDFGYDANGNVRSVTDVGGNGQRSKTLSYDGLNRLVRADSPLWGTETYQHDGLGNLRAVTSSTGRRDYLYDARQLLVAIAAAGYPRRDFAYDVRGNVTERDGTAMRFDEADQMVSIDGLARYAYDASGHRVRKDTASGSQYTLYNQAGRLLWEYDTRDAMAKDYVFVANKSLGFVRQSASDVVGNIDGFVHQGDVATLRGWACSSGLSKPIDVHVYVDNGFFRVLHADEVSEDELHASCHAKGSAWRFSLTLTEEERVSYAWLPVAVYGISPVGRENHALKGSGAIEVPVSVYAPLAPERIDTTLSADKQRIDVAWAASDKALLYRAEYRNGDGPWQKFHSSDMTQGVVRTPEDGNFVVRARACNASGCSAWRTSGNVFVGHVPDTVTKLNVPATANGPVSLSWTVMRYAVRYELDDFNGSGWTRRYNDAATSVTLQVAKSGNYTYRVRGCNPNGCGGYATSAAVVVTIPPASAPNLEGGGTSHDGNYGLAWSDVYERTYFHVMEHGQPIFRVDGTSWGTSGRSNGGYVYQVQACNAGGCGPWSNQVVVTVALLPLTPRQPTLSQSGGSDKPVVTAKWSATAHAENYEVRTTNEYGYSEPLYWGPDTTMRSLIRYTGSLTWSVRACNSVGCSAWGPGNTMRFESGD